MSLPQLPFTRDTILFNSESSGNIVDYIFIENVSIANRYPGLYLLRIILRHVMIDACL